MTSIGVIGNICQRLIPALFKKEAKRIDSGPKSPIPQRDGKDEM
jgi:hypothetical protein